MDKSKDILVVAETSDGKCIPLVYELLGLGRRLASETGSAVYAVTLGNPASELPSLLIAQGADRVFVLPNTEATEYYQSDVWLSGMREVLAKASPGIILIGHTALGADLAPRLAFRLKVAIATGCEQVAMNGNKLLVTRPCFGNKAREVLSLTSSPSIVTIRAKMHEPMDSDPGRRGEIVNLTVPDNKTMLLSKVIERKQEDAADGVRLENASMIVAGGRGLGGPEGFKVLEKLASALGGAVGASRVACDLGWCPHSWQIGLTGKTVTPDLYIAVGISGASHHMAGCGNAKAILAINTDPEAAIFKEARFGVVGDYKEIVPALMDEIGRQKGQQPEHNSSSRGSTHSS